MAAGGPMSVTEAMRARISTRGFLRDRPVPVEVIQEILEIASRAPSGGNTQPWHLYVLAGEARDALVAALQRPGAFASAGVDPDFRTYPPDGEAPAAYSARRRKVGYDMFDLMGIDRNDSAARQAALLRNFDFFGAPVGIIVTVDRAGDRNAWGHVGMLLQSVCLLAEERGLGTCLQEAWGNLGKTVYAALEIPDSEVVWCGLALGHPDPSQPLNRLRTEREPPAAFASLRGFEGEEARARARL